MRRVVCVAVSQMGVGRSGDLRGWCCGVVVVVVVVEAGCVETPLVLSFLRTVNSGCSSILSALDLDRYKLDTSLDR